MKGIVFHFNSNKKFLRLPDIKERSRGFKSLVSRFGMQTVLAVLFVLGLVIGAASSKSFDKEVLDRLDLLFVTNLDSRMGMSVVDIFIACFVSYFLFILCVFLAAASVWGFAAIPLLAALKGFTVGVSTAFIFSLYKLPGIGFYILVVLPGTVLFLFTYIRYSTESFRMSLRYFKLSVFGADREPGLARSLKRFLKRTLFAFLASGVCSAVDMILWILFAGKFDFK